jgi:hypothetical protein
MKLAYRTPAALAPEPAPLVVARPDAARRRLAWVLLAWAPAHLALAAACGAALGPATLFPLLLAGLGGVACAAHACALRAYDERAPLTALVAPPPRTARLLWAVVLMVPVFGVVAYLIAFLRAHAPESHDVNPKGLPHHATEAKSHACW